MPNTQDQQASVVTSIIFRTLASLGAMALPAIIWALSQITSLREDNILLKSQVAHFPEMIEAALMRVELKSANDNLQRAMQAHEAQQQQQAQAVSPGKGKP